MRMMKLLGMLGLVLAVSGTVEAVTVPTFPAGAIALENYNRDQGTGYQGPSGTYTRAARGGAWDASLTVTPAIGAWANAGEDTWGIFSMATIIAGVKNGNDIYPAGAAIPTYIWDPGSNMTGNTALVGVFYGGWDKTVEIDTTTTTPTLTVYSEHVQFELWAVDKSNVDLSFHRLGPAYNAANRTAQNEYTGWVTGSDATKVKLLSGISTEFRFTGTFNPNTGTFAGQTLTLWDINENDATGLWNTAWGSSASIDPFIDDFGNLADLLMSFDIRSGTDGWAVNSTDTGGLGYAVPEPLTMLGVLLGVGGVGGYIRRRRAAL